MVPPETVNSFAAALTIVAQVAAAFLFVGILLERRGNVPAYITLLRHHALRATFAVALAASLGSMFYSDIMGYAPCVLCWWQRVFMYPQAVIAGVALWKQDRRALSYLSVLAALGAAIAGYHYLLEWGLIPAGLCPATGTGPSCAQRFVYEFGYISIPLMSLTAFALLFLIAFIGQKEHRIDSSGKTG